jgi:phenylalanyl-tRNA synthetase alpha chain
MKMYKRPLTEVELRNYLAITDLTLGETTHVISLLYQKIESYITISHSSSDVQVHRPDPIVTSIENYDSLLIAADNISRSSTYTHYVSKTHVLRTHTSAHLPGILRELASHDDWDDVVILLPGLAYRRDVSDKKHVGEVHMLEMWRVVRNSARRVIVKDDLLAVVSGIARTAASSWKLRIIDSPHPYTRGGIEVNAIVGDRDIEILECGLIKDDILGNAGLDPGEYSGWALGMGLDRLAMTLKGIPDIRYLRSVNPKIAQQMTDLEPYREVSRQPAIQRDMSYSVPKSYVEEDISDDIRRALANQADTLESVELLSQSSYESLPQKIRNRLGIQSDQKNVLVQVTLRHLGRSIANREANELYDQIYAQVNYGSAGYV